MSSSDYPPFHPSFRAPKQLNLQSGLFPQQVYPGTTTMRKKSGQGSMHSVQAEQVQMHVFEGDTREEKSGGSG